MISCPKCGVRNKHVYAGFYEVQCTSVDCEQYSESAYKSLQTELAQALLNSEPVSLNTPEDQEQINWFNYTSGKWHP